MSNSGFTTTAIIFLIVGALVIGSGVYFWQSQQTEITIPLPCDKYADTADSNKRSNCIRDYENVNESCKEITDFTERMQCNSDYIENESVSIFEKNNIQECGKLRGKIETVAFSANGEDYCKYLFATANNNSSLCAQLEPESVIRSRCYTDLSRKNADFSACDEVDASLGGSDFCKISLGLDIGRNAQNISRCDAITDERYKQACIFGVAESTKNSDICDAITVNEFVTAFNFSKEECLRRIQKSPSGKPTN